MDMRLRIYRCTVLAICLLARSAWAEDKPPPEPVDVFYKGIVGKVLDAVPMDKDQRVQLQRTNTVVSNTLTGRSLAAWAGLSNPLFMIGGLIYGLFSASRIKPETTSAPSQSRLVETQAGIEAAQGEQPRPAD